MVSNSPNSILLFAINIYKHLRIKLRPIYNIKTKLRFWVTLWCTKMKECRRIQTSCFGQRLPNTLKWHDTPQKKYTRAERICPRAPKLRRYMSSGVPLNSKCRPLARVLSLRNVYRRRTSLSAYSCGFLLLISRPAAVGGRSWHFFARAPPHKYSIDAFTFISIAQRKASRVCKHTETFVCVLFILLFINWQWCSISKHSLASLLTSPSGKTRFVESAERASV